MAKIKERFANIGLVTTTMSAANTLTFGTIQMAAGMFQGIAMIIHRVLWWPYTATVREIVAATDSLQMAITNSNRITTIADATDPAIVAMKRIVAVAANVASVELPLVSDFTALPGGGKITAANPLYLAVSSGGFAAAGIVAAQLEFSSTELSDADYLEVLQAQFPANVV